jgi:spermidine synthase
MTVLDSSRRSLRSERVAAAAAPALFTATMFASALLLFSIQPMFAKMVLPRLGGSPAVWSVAMVFFQAALLTGYGYAHVLSRALQPRHAALIHLIVLCVAATALPLHIAGGFDAPPTSGVEFWLIALFAASIGLPFTALSASAPLLQNWFAAGVFTCYRNPYALYAASNLGSFVSLLCYPFLIEPLLTVHAQTMFWSVGFTVLALMIALAGLVVAQGAVAPHLAATSAEPAPKIGERARWIAYGAVPAGLTVAVTAFISTDVAAAPFMWVVPLAIYLLTFVAVFRDKPWFREDTLARLVPIVVAPVALTLLSIVKFWALVIVLNIAAFAVLCLFCHSELYRRRPTPAHLTEFYFWISCGGVIGGAFAGLLAPNAFNGVYEYPILICAALLLLPGTFTGGPREFLLKTWPIWLAIACVLAGRSLISATPMQFGEIAGKITLVGLVALMLLLRNQPARAATVLVLIFIISDSFTPELNRVARIRSFFGVHQIVETASGKFRMLLHGTTNHGAMRIRNDDGSATTGRPTPLTYYFDDAPMPSAIAMLRAKAGAPIKLAVIGLGSGTLACYRRADESWTFYEIDEAVVRIARDAKMFRFLSECAPDAPIVLGDARLTLAKSAERYDVILLDAFSSDAIPVHLLTREAFAMYRERLNPGGAIIVHISNRHLDLRDIVASAGAAMGFTTFIRFDQSSESSWNEQFRTPSIVAAMVQDQSGLETFKRDPRWKVRNKAAADAAWTDDFSNILGALLRMKFPSLAQFLEKAPDRPELRPSLSE